MITTKNIQQKKKVKRKTGFGMTCPINNNKPKPKLPSVYLSTIHRTLDKHLELIWKHHKFHTMT